MSPIRRSISAPETNIRFSNASRSPYRIHFYSRRLFDIKDFPVSPCRAVLSGALREKLRRGPPRRSFLLVGRQSPLGGAAVLELLESMASSARRGVMSEMGPKAPFSAFAEYFRSTSISRRSQSRWECLKGANSGHPGSGIKQSSRAHSNPIAATIAQAVGAIRATFISLAT